jgi:hypothetical protein
MKQITITTAKAQILIVDLPLGSDFHKVNNGNVLEYDPMTNPIEGEWSYSKLPEGSWQLLGKASELSEEQWRMIVAWNTQGNMAANEKPFYDYDMDMFRLNTAVESGSSLLSANGVILVNPIKKESWDEIYDRISDDLSVSDDDLKELCYQTEFSDHLKWQAAEEKVWRNPYVLVKTKP